jgi:NAD(P)H-flavin reductase
MQMKNRLPARCMDINSPYCPCILAETNHCVYCSHLRGEAVCDCNWTGVCVLNEKKWQATNTQKKWRWEENTTRNEIEAPIITQECIAENTYRLELSVPLELAQTLDRPGSFVFLRRIEDPEFFKFPVGIMGVKGEIIEMVIETIGPKSSRILEDQPRPVIVRGPYYNGVFGQPWVDKISEGYILLLAGGMGQPPAAMIAQKLITNNNKVLAILAPGKVGKVLVDQLFKSWGIEVMTVSSMRREGLVILREWIKTDQCPDLIVSAGPDDQHYGIINTMQAENKNIPMAATNNATMCCGEGVCGSCDKETRSGKKVRTCKVQTDFLSFI